MELKKLLASRHLKESHQLSAFLEFIVEETLEGRRDGLKEYLLGQRIFGRRPDYDPRHDGIVRVQATTLRKRLEKYYAEDGLADPVVIDLPRGGYVPAFRQAAGAATAPLADETVAAPAPPVQPGRRRLLLAFLAGAAAMLLIALLLGVRLGDSPVRAFHMTAASANDFPAFWSPLLDPKVETVVAYGVPLFYHAGGLYFRHVEVNVPDGAGQGHIREFGRKFNISPQPTDDTYTGVGEVEGTHLLSNFFAINGVPVKVTNARTLGLSDVASRNLVVVSSLRFQTLLRELKLPQRFEFQPIRPETIENLNPAPGEDRQYTYRGGAGVSTSYAVVSVWPGLSPERRIVHIGGVHTWSTQAATEFMLDPAQLRKLTTAFARPGEETSPYFQILLRVEGRGNRSQKVEYVTHHYLDRNAKAEPVKGS